MTKMIRYLFKASAIIWLISNADGGSIAGSTDYLLNATLNAVDQALSFYVTQYMNVNLDGIFGLRILQGQLSVIIAEYKNSGSKIDIDLLSRLQNMQTEAARVSDTSLGSIQSYEPEYFKLMGKVVRQPFTYAKPFRHINPSLHNNSFITKRSANTALNSTNTERSRMSMTEEVSDRCIEELLGRGDVACVNVSVKCVEIMTRPGLSDFDITHQLIYIMFNYLNNCTEIVNPILHKLNRGGNDTGKIQELLCTSNFYEVSDAVRIQNGLILPRMQDLFLEQQFVCPMAGYVEFLHADWLRQIVSWQRTNGCWGKMKKSERIRTTSNDDYDYEPDNNNKTPSVVESELQYSEGLRKNIWNNSNKGRVSMGLSVQDIRKKVSHIQNQPSNRFTGRKLLYDRMLSDGCLSHKTAVALGALSQYLRILLSPSSKYLQGINHLMNPDKLVDIINSNPISSNSPTYHKEKSPQSAVIAPLDNFQQASDAIRQKEKFLQNINTINDKENSPQSADITSIENSLSLTFGRKLSNASDYVILTQKMNKNDEQDDDDDNVGDAGQAGDAARRDEDLNNDYLEEENEEILDQNEEHGERDHEQREPRQINEPHKDHADDKGADSGNKEDYVADKGLEADDNGKQAGGNEDLAGDKDDNNNEDEDYARNDRNSDYLKNVNDQRDQKPRIDHKAARNIIPVDSNKQDYDDISMLKARGRPGLLDPSARFADIPKSLEQLNNGPASNRYSSVSLMYVLVMAVTIVAILVLYRFTRRRRFSLFSHRRT